tara:strand:+ start:459 stop:782 length:324 start_codon:yes stop_codon:yes gene_type:complete
MKDFLKGAFSGAVYSTAFTVATSVLYTSFGLTMGMATLGGLAIGIAAAGITAGALSIMLPSEEMTDVPFVGGFLAGSLGTLIAIPQVESLIGINFVRPSFELLVTPS